MAVESYVIEELIPHRSPMLLVDTVLDVTPFEFIKAERTFAKDDPIFGGHFPGHPVLPGVLGIEALAQAGALLVNISVGKKSHETLFFFMSIEKSKFRLPIYPGDVVTLEVKMVRKRGNVFRFEAQAKLGEKVASEVSFTAKLEELS